MDFHFPSFYCHSKFSERGILLNTSANNGGGVAKRRLCVFIQAPSTVITAASVSPFV